VRKIHQCLRSSSRFLTCEEEHSIQLIGSFVAIVLVSTSGLLWWFDEANQVKMFKTLWAYVECMKSLWRLKTWS